MNLCIGIMAVGPEYRRMARELISNLRFLREKNIPFLVMTDAPSEFDSGCISRPCKSSERYHSRRHIVRLGLELFETVVMIDADSEVKVPFDMPEIWPPGFCGTDNKIIDIPGMINTSTPENQRHPEKLPRVQELASNLGLDVSTIRWPAENLYVVTRDGGREKIFLDTWDELVLELGRQTTRTQIGKATLIGLALAKVGWKFQEKPLDVLLRLMKHLRTSPVLGLKLEYDITYRCNLRCHNCDRQCRNFPSDEMTTLDTARKLVRETLELEVRWDRIGILGGEPTLHPRCKEIVEIVRPICDMIRLNTNGVKLDPDLSKYGIEPGDSVVNSMKKTERHSFDPVCMAPRDVIEIEPKEYHKGCYVPRKCGFGYSPSGQYFVCGCGGAIDRVFGLHSGFDRLSDLLDDDKRNEQFEMLCSLCGRFLSRNHDFSMVTEDAFSKSWLEMVKNR